ncbi:gliding motility-associated C-terminal domain-containing protein [bacterium]|nr:gliding motility-associated C-terminal domain-containing protein [bacterium]
MKSKINIFSQKRRNNKGLNMYNKIKLDSKIFGLLSLVIAFILIPSVSLDSSALGDIDGIEGIFLATGREIATVSDDGRLTVWNRYRKVVTGWPKALTGRVFYTSPILVDLDNDRASEILVCSKDSVGNIKMHAFHSSGSDVAGWPRDINVPISDTPIASDMDGDGDLDFVAGTSDGNVYVWDDHDGTSWVEIETHTVTSGEYTYLTLKDIDEDGISEIFANCGDGSVAVWNYTAGWITFDSGNILVCPPAAGDLDGDGIADILLGDVNGNVDILTYDGAISFNRTLFTIPTTVMGIRIFNYDNTGNPEILITGLGGHSTIIDFTGTVIEVFQQRSSDFLIPNTGYFRGEETEDILTCARGSEISIFSNIDGEFYTEIWGQFAHIELEETGSVPQAVLEYPTDGTGIASSQLIDVTASISPISSSDIYWILMKKNLTTGERTLLPLDDPVFNMSGDIYVSDQSVSSEVVYNWDPALETDGGYRFILKGMDGDGLFKRHIVNVLLDRVPPIAEITYPVADQWVGASCNIKGTATDDHIRSYEISYAKKDSTEYTTIINKQQNISVTDSLLVVWDTTTLTSGGEYKLKLVVTDGADNVTEDEILINVDKTFPQILVSEINSASSISSGSKRYFNTNVALNIDIIEDHLVESEILLDGIPSENSIELDNEGIYNLNVYASDIAGNTTRFESKIIIDKTAPLIDVYGVKDGDIFQNTIILPQIFMIDQNINSDISYITLDGNPYNEGEQIASEGHHVLDIYAIDKAGNSTVRRINFNIETTTYTYEQYADETILFAYDVFGLYHANRREIRMDVTFPYTHSSQPEISASSNGLEFDSYINDYGWAEVVPGSFKNYGCGIAGCTVRTFIYWINSQDMWSPFDPEAINFSVTVEDGENMGPSINPFEYSYGGNRNELIAVQLSAFDSEKVFYIDGDPEFPIYDYDGVEYEENSNTEASFEIIENENRLKITVSKKYSFWSGEFSNIVYVYGRKDNPVEPDVTPPFSTVVSLASPITDKKLFTPVSWSGADNSGDPLGFNINYKINDGSWEIWNIDACGTEYTHSTSSNFPWTQFSKNTDRIYFKSISKDSSCNIEPAKPESAYDTYIDIELPVQNTDIITASRSGDMIKSFTKDGFPETFGVSEFPTKGVNVTTGDIDGNGVEEIIVSKISKDGNDSYIDIYSFYTMEKLISFCAFGVNNYGCAIAAGDIDGDGVDEIIAGKGHHLNYYAKVKIFKIEKTDSSYNATETKSFFAFSNDIKHGANVSCGDVDDDGVDEIIVGKGPGASNDSRINIFSYENINEDYPSPEKSFFAFGDIVTSGVYLSCGNISGKNYEEIVCSKGEVQGNDSNIRVYDILNMDSAYPVPIYNFNAYLAPNTNGCIHDCGDIDLDGYDEIVTSPGAGSLAANRIKIFQKDELEGRFYAYDQCKAGGISVAVIEGKQDILPPVTDISLRYSVYETQEISYVVNYSQISLTARDEGELATGVENTYFRINDSSWQIYTAPFRIHDTLMLPGLNSIEYYSQDNVGNSEEVHHQQIFLDDQPPIIDSIDVSPSIFSPNNDECNDNVEFRIAAHDDGSGLYYECVIAIYNGPIVNTNLVKVLFPVENNGEYVISWDGTDADGNLLGDAEYQVQVWVDDNLHWFTDSTTNVTIDMIQTELSHMSDPQNITNNLPGNHSTEPIWEPTDSKYLFYIDNRSELTRHDISTSEKGNLYSSEEVINIPTWFVDKYRIPRIAFIESTFTDWGALERNELKSVHHSGGEETYYDGNHIDIISHLKSANNSRKLSYTIANRYFRLPVWITGELYQKSLIIDDFPQIYPAKVIDFKLFLDEYDPPIWVSCFSYTTSSIAPGEQYEEAVVASFFEVSGYDPETRGRKDLVFVHDEDFIERRIWLTNDSAMEKNPEFSPDGSKIIYLSSAGGFWNIWLIKRNIPYEGYIQPYNTDNFHPPVQLTYFTDNSIDENSIQWTGNGDKISFIRTLDDDPANDYIRKAIFYMDYTGMDQGMLFEFKTKRENNGAKSFYEWSDQGHLVYSDYDEANDITDIKIRYMIWEDPCDPEYYNAPGDIVSSDGLVEVEIESDDLYQGMEYIEITSVDNVSSVPEYSEISGMVIGDVYEISSRSGINYFKDNIEIAFNYDDLTILGYDEANYQAYTYDEENSEWVIAQPDELLTTRDYDSNQITIEMLHLSYYALCYHHNEPGPPEILSISIAPEYLSPNGDGVNDSLAVSVSVSEESIVHLGIFNRDGDEIYWSEANAPNEVPITFTWNGKDLDNEPVTDDGVYEVYLYARDLGGEYSDEHFTSFTIDLTSAQTRIEVNPISSLNEVIKGSMIILHADDALSGVQYTQYRFDDDEWRHYTESMNLASFGYGLHTIEYRSIDNTGNVESINSLQFELVEAFDISADISVIPSILIWENFSNVSEDQHEQLSEYFDNLGGIITYDIVESSGEFVSGMRSGSYNEYIILGNAENLEGHTSEELREHVYSGKGLITSHYYHFLGEGVVPEVLGIRYSGVYDGYNLTINLVNSPITEEGVLTTTGTTYTVESLGSFESGYVTVSPHLPSPVIIGNNYGEGKTVYFAFDIFSSLEDAGDILAAAIDYVKPEEESVISGGYNTVRISVKSNVFDLQTKISEILPEGTEIIEVIPVGEIESNIVDWNELITAGETRKYYVFARLPDTGDEFIFTTEVSYLANGIWWEEEPFAFTESVSYDPETLNSDIIEMLNELDADEKEMKFIFNAIKCLEKIPTAEDREKAILECLKAINNVRQVESTDIHEIRILLDQLLIEIS